MLSVSAARTAVKVTNDIPTVTTIANSFFTAYLANAVYIGTTIAIYWRIRNLVLENIKTRLRMRVFIEAVARYATTLLRALARPLTQR